MAPTNYSKQVLAQLRTDRELFMSYCTFIATGLYFLFCSILQFCPRLYIILVTLA